MYRGILLMGGNGCGKTTLGKRVAALLGCPHIDMEDYAFEPSEIPYARPRPREEVCALIRSQLRAHPRFVFSAVNGDMGEEINALYDFIVYIHAPLAVRMERMQKRSLERFGSRVLEGGDMYESEQAFMRFAAGRSLEKAERWTKDRCCPVFCVDGTLPIETNAQLIVKRLEH